MDDDGDALTMVCDILEASGASVWMATSAKGALDTLDQRCPDVLIADLSMPEVDGFDLIAGVRAHRNPAVRELPATALTAYARSEDRVRALQSGFNMHLSKPIDPAELMAAVVTLHAKV